MSVEALRAELDIEKGKFNAANSRIEELRRKIGETLCPVQIGEVVAFKKNGKLYRGRVDGIHYDIPLMDSLFPEPGTSISWAVYGTRINKTTGEVGKIQFGFGGLQAEQIEGIWHVAHKPDPDGFLNEGA